MLSRSNLVFKNVRLCRSLSYTLNTNNGKIYAEFKEDNVNEFEDNFQSVMVMLKVCLNRQAICFLISEFFRFTDVIAENASRIQNGAF